MGYLAMIDNEIKQSRKHMFYIFIYVKNTFLYKEIC